MCLLHTVDLQRGRSLGSPHSVFRHTCVSALVLLLHLQQTESVVAVDLEPAPAQRGEQIAAAWCEEFYIRSVLTSETIVLYCSCSDFHSQQHVWYELSFFNSIIEDSPYKYNFRSE